MWFDVSYLLSSPISFSPIYHMKREFSKASSSSRSSSCPVCVVPGWKRGLCLYTPVTAGTQNTYPKSYKGTKKIMKWYWKKKKRKKGVIYWYPRRWDRKGKYRGQQGDFAAGNRASLRTFSSSSQSQHHWLDECRCYGLVLWQKREKKDATRPERPWNEDILFRFAVYTREKQFMYSE